MLRFLTSGESHGRCLVAILEGMVAGLEVDEKEVNAELARRQMGYGRGGRMAIEKDEAQILSGVRFKKTIGSPIALLVPNKDFKINDLPVVKRPRPGHADLVGAIKYEREDVRDVLERASARETVARVAVGAVCRIFLKAFGIEVTSHVVVIGGVQARTEGLSFEEVKRRSSLSPVRCADEDAGRKMMRLIDRAKQTKDTVGGVFEVIARGVPVGLGSFVHYDRRLSAKLCAALASIQAVKGVEIGMGFKVSETFGRRVHDEIFHNRKRGFYRKTNNAGGFEGGVTNGENLVLRAAVKPYSTLMSPLRSVNIDTKKEEPAAVERSDVTAVPACGVIGEAMAAFELANSFLEKFGGDSLKETQRNFMGYKKQIEKF
ncbi:MAG: chorismate synthase [Candidatus Omnitrophica bacterium]|nr:chorismate synthase [Candidatus Omnitrophota bacterium]